MTGLALGVALAWLPLSAEAQGVVAQDTPWLAWVGCWAGSEGADGQDQAEEFTVCFQPTGNPDAVELLTYSDGELVSLEELVADGVPRPLAEGGCEGERTALWSANRPTVFLSSEMQCAEGLLRITRGIMSLLPGGGSWSEVQSVTAGDQPPVVGIRTFAAESPADLASQGVPDPAAGSELAVRTAREVAGGPLSPRAIVELVERAGPAATSALIVQRGEPFGLDPETLRALSARGVPGEVLDVMVAVTYPERFEVTGGDDIEPTPRSDDTRAMNSPRTWPPSRGYRGYSPWRFGMDLYYDPFFGRWYSPYGRFGYGGFGYLDRYGYGANGYGPFGPYGYYPRPGVIVIERPVVRDRATLSRESGVVRPTGSDGSGTAVRRGSGGGSGDNSLSRDGGVSRSGDSRSGSSAPPRSSSGSSSPSSSSGSSDVRQARPR
jgi:hypothetical protein